MHFKELSLCIKREERINNTKKQTLKMLFTVPFFLLKVNLAGAIEFKNLIL